VHDGERVDVVALALRLGADGLGLLDGRKPEREIRRRRRAVRIVEQRQRDAPEGHAAFATSSNISVAWRYPNECWYRMPRSKRRCAVSLHDVMKWTVPSR